MLQPSNPIYSRLLVRHHWLVLTFVVFICVTLTTIGIVFTQFPDFSDPRIGWGARGKGTIFSQLMVLCHASERFRLAYELPLDTNELFGAFNQYENHTVEDFDETSYRSDLLTKTDLWKKKNADNQLNDYQNLNEDFYENDLEEIDNVDYEENIQAPLLYQWHRDRHFDIKSSIVKFVDDKRINITILDFIKNLPQFNKDDYQSSRLNFDLFLPYAYLLEEKYRGRTGRDGMIEFYIERTNPSDDLLSFDHLKSICQWEKKFKKLLSLDQMPSLSLATFVALYSSKNDCQLITENDIEHFRSILHTCLPYYLNGYMDIPLSDQFLNRVIIKHDSNYSTLQDQLKAVYAALRHTCFYKNITRFIFDHFLDKKFVQNFSQSKLDAKLSISMIYITNYKIMKINRTRDQTMCLRRQSYSIKYCLEHGCTDDYKNNFLIESCAEKYPNCQQYCQCKYQCLNESEQVIVLVPNLKGSELVHFFEKYFRDPKLFRTYKDEYVRLIALNLANVREKAAMVQIHKDMLLVAIAATLIIVITILYFRSISIALIIVLSAGFSLGVSYFIYRVIYQIPIFPYMNLMCAFILIGIGCDDTFVFFDTWDQEKLAWLKRYQEKSKIAERNLDVEIPLNSSSPKKCQNPSTVFQSQRLFIWQDSEEIQKLLVTEEVLIEIMSNTLKHAASSMFVTSFTTAAAFFTNMLTNISFVQVFGVFTGTCILIYFIITVTAIAAFVIIYEKYIQDFVSRIFYSNAQKSSSKHFCQHFSMICKTLRNYIFNHFLPVMIIKFRYIFVFLFILLGIFGFVGVFYYPKMQVPRTQKVTFFLQDHPMEIYEFSMKNEFNGYSKEERRLFAYPAVSFIFGIQDIDDGYIFDMNDRGRLHLMPIKLHQKQTLEFFKDFIEHLGIRNDLFSSNYDLEQDFQAFYQLTTDNILLTKLIDDQIKSNISRTDHLTMINYLKSINKTLIQNLIENTVLTMNYNRKKDQSNRDDYNQKTFEVINPIVYDRAMKQLINSSNPTIIYSNFRKLFNKTLVKIYRDQIEQDLNLDQLRAILNTTYRDQLTEEYQRSALKTGMQCLTGVAGENNIPAEFCENQLKKQRSINWAVLPDKPSPIDGSVRPFAVIITIRGAFNRTDYDSYNKYYLNVKNFFDPYIKLNAPKHFQHAWFSSPGFAFYGIQHELLVGSFSSLIASLGIALLVLFLTSGNLFIAIYALITITFAIADTVAIFAILNWELGIVEAIIVIMSVGLSVDFVVHFGVAYIHTDKNHIENERIKVRNRHVDDTNITNYRLLFKEYHVERVTRVNESVSRVGSAVFMAAFTTFAAGFSMTLSSLSSFREMGQFLMTIMTISWVFATFFFLPLCTIIGPVGQCGSIPFSRLGESLRRCVRRN